MLKKVRLKHSMNYELGAPKIVQAQLDALRIREKAHAHIVAFSAQRSYISACRRVSVKSKEYSAPRALFHQLI